MPARLSPTDFDVLIRRAGLALTPEQVADLYEAWEYVEPMLDRVRGTARGREAEPAVMFRAEPLP